MIHRLGVLIALSASLVAAAGSEDESLRGFLKTQEFSHYVAAFADLNGDGRQEAIVYDTESDGCGSGGCSMLILARTGNSWQVVTAMTICRPPVRVLDSISHGWRDLSVRVSGGGILTPYDAQLKFDGRSYPENPTVSPAQRLRKQEPGQVLISAEQVERSFREK